MGREVLIIGGGLAGLAAALALSQRSFRVTVLEARDRLGGRASSFIDAATGQAIDTCQHVTMGCCTNFAHFCREVGIDKLLQPQSALYFMTPDRRVSRMAASRWPAPFHLLRSFLAAHYLPMADKVRIAWGLMRLREADVDHDPPFADWLARNRQTPRSVQRFWGVVLTSALNETPERVGLRYAKKVFVDAFMNDRRGMEVTLPTVPLGRLYGDELQRTFAKYGVRIRTNHAVKTLVCAEGKALEVQLRQGDAVRADWYILAAPFDRVLSILPDEVLDGHSNFSNLRQLRTSPITSVHLWYREPVMHHPHLVLVDCVGQWVFNRGRVATGEHYLQVVVSAARQFQRLGREEVERRVVAELASLFPGAEPRALARARVITEHSATFSAVPGVDKWRPCQETPIANLFLAGDWTATNWPATMEGAVRSGYLAAEAILRRNGTSEKLLQSDL